MGELTLGSRLEAPADRVWERVTDLRGINDELWPVLRMTAPPGWTRLDPDRVRPGERLFRSWLLLFGVLPVDVDDLAVAELGPGPRFVERSRMLSASVWEHEREVQPLGAGACEVVDRVRFVPRWRPLGPVLGWVVPRLFAHRHRRLRAAFRTS
jgi:hypothetical protein